MKPLQYKRFAWFIAAALVVTMVASVVVCVAYVSANYQALTCHFRTFSPADRFIPGPHQLDQHWRTFDLKKPLETVPDIQHLTVIADPSTHTRIEGDPELPELPRSRLKPIGPGPIVQLDVELLLQGGQSLRLTQNRDGYRFYDDISYPSVGFGIAHPDFEPIYFPKDISFTGFRIRASSPIEVHAFEWRASSYFRDPCRTWDDITDEFVYKMGTPIPERGRLKINEESNDAGNAESTR